ncbi:DUF935 domain-containing protein [uncultured Tateyamaria sp.]|uniref:DUF935 domain-containing protein n=1 Tax=uncultured Tateyamaria sp. TaxID=455651 RepID=UPI00261B54FC|nr:DUF935 domain-containing protein [uncultured Tateyamaria sp.]
MARTPQLVDQWGRPIKRAALTQEIMGATTSGVRSPLTGHPADGLDPRKLAMILREADAGDPLRYLELAEFMEERDLHYVGVLGTRRRSVSQLDISVEDASDDPTDKQIAEDLRGWLKRGELQTELFHVLDAIGKGYSTTEIVWDTSMGQFWPKTLKRVDQRWFRFDRINLTTPLMVDDSGGEQPLPGGKFIWADFQAKSGIPARAGLARIISWAYLFKKFTERDWAVFSQTYGQPLRLGKFGPGASEQDRRTLMRAVSDIAGDCAAIIPESMMIEFIQTGQVSASSDLYEKRGDWYDKQVSKAVLGQTSTTDAEVGGLGSGKEHRQVQEDIERADATDLAAILTRDLVIPFVQLNYGPRKRYPRLIIARPEAEDLKAWTETVLPWAEAGLAIAEDDVYDKLALKRPADGAKILEFARKPKNAGPGGDGDAPTSQIETRLNAHQRKSGTDGPEPTQRPPEGRFSALSEKFNALRSEQERDVLDDPTDRLARAAAPAMERMLETIEAMLEQSDSLDAFLAALLEGFPDVDVTELAEAIGAGTAAVYLGGMAAVDADG